MKRKLPTLLIMLALTATGFAYWMDLSLFTDHATGFVHKGTVWIRYAIIAIPLALCALGLLSVGPRAIAAMRMRSKGLGIAFILAAVAGIGYGASLLYSAYTQRALYPLALGVLFLWYGIWSVLVAAQMFTQRAPAPTKSAIWGLLAALPFCVQTVYRVLVKPASLYRIAPLVRIFAALCAMLWAGMLLRALYIALVRTRARWMYLFGLFAFLFGVLELVQTVYSATLQPIALDAFMEAVNMFTFGLVAACVSVSIAGKGTAEPPKKLAFTDPLAGDATPDADNKSVYRSPYR